MKAQVAFEYIIIVGFVITMLIPVWSYMTAVNEQVSRSLIISQTQTASNRLASASDLVYTQGSPAQITIDVYIPSGVYSSQIINTTINFKIYSGEDITDVTAVSLGPLNGSLPMKEGLYKFKIKAIEDYVNISY